MLDIKFIRENKELIASAAKKKHIEFNVEELVSVDDKRRSLLSLIEGKRAEQNIFNTKITEAGDPETRERFIAEMKLLKDDLQGQEKELKEILKKWQTLMVAVPNVPDVSVPDGLNDEDNKEVKTWGKRADFSFIPKSHIEIMESLDMLDLERGSKVAGFRGYILKNDAVLLNFALWQAALAHFLGKGFSPMMVPSLVRRELLIGSGYLPQGEEDLYKTQDSEYLAGTSEVAMMGYYADEVIPKEKLPSKFLAFSPCFRREAGSHGKDTKGIFRVHEFFKLEQVIFSEASHEESVKWHEWLNRNTEEFMEALGLPYRTVVNCGGDLGLGQVKKYDIDLWVPSEGKYREISSASYFHDFQTRRLNIRYKDTDGKTKFVHSLNCTALPSPRVLISLIENYQQADGTVIVPPLLEKYLGKKILGRK
ncbi:MAG: serine--tRNA ligase [Candidatus Taylorbacteria bacterium RIFCSPLOWO2_01_FULL_45_34b]|nr:MAG: serine--tRNA ligase [Candidatus Taylorbacteria bacterium RIFCSPLOWO2_01_FULL_45_34b]